MFLQISTLSFLVAFAYTQSSKVVVPSDLSSQFDPNSIALQVSYNGNAEAGLLDGAQVTQQESSKAPVFALGDASGVNTAISFVVAMVDTTTSDRVLHFLQPDFKADGTETGISSASKPTIAYQGPGTLKDTGTRQYSWLLYQQVRSFPAKSIPDLGQILDVETFQTANNLKPALAGIAMAVNVAGAASTSTASAPPPPISASSSPLLPITTPAVITVAPATSSSIASSASLISTSVPGAVTFVSIQPSSRLAAPVSSLVSSVFSADVSTTAVASILSSLSLPLGTETGNTGSGLASASSAAEIVSTTLALQKSSATVSSSIAQSTGGAATLAQDMITLCTVPIFVAFAGCIHWI